MSKNSVTYDTETTGLSSNDPGVFYDRKTGKPRYASWEELRMTRSHLSLTQFATSEYNESTGKYDIFNRIIVDQPKKPFPSILKEGAKTRPINAGGISFQAAVTKTRTLEKSKLVDAMMKAYDGAYTRQQVEEWVDRNGSRILRQSSMDVYSINDLGLDITESKFAFEKRIEMEEHFAIGEETKLTKILDNIAKTGIANINNGRPALESRVTKEQGSLDLELMVKSWISRGKNATFTVSGVNTIFDIEQTRAELLFSGKTNLLKELDASLESGQVVVEDVSRVFKGIIYRGLKQDSRFLDKEGNLVKQFIIRQNPGAAVELGLNRVGNRVRTEAEFMHSNVSATGQKMNTFFSDLLEMNKALPGGEVIHGAGPDVLPENITQKKLHEILRLEREEGLTIEEAFKRIGVKNYKDRMWNIFSEAESSEKWQKGLTLVKNPINKTNKRGISSSLVEAKNAIFGANSKGMSLKTKSKLGLVLAAVVATYGFTRSETKDSLNDRIKRKVSAITGFFRGDSDRVRIGKHADRKRQTLKTAALTVALPSAVC